MVTFKTKNYRSVSMLSRDANIMLRLMGLRPVVPGALNAEDVPTALEVLKKAIEIHGEEPTDTGNDGNDEDEEKQPPVVLKTRAFPLIELLSAAAESNEYVMWE